MASYSEILFGRILLKNRLATFAQIQDCLRLAKGQTLGEVMIQKGLIKPEQARQVQKAQALMQFMRAEKLFARILVERKIVDVATLRKAFEVQEKQRYKVRLAQILMERGLIDADQVDEVVDAQLMLLAEETGRIEEEGLAGAMNDSRAAVDGTSSQIDGLTKERAVENLDASQMNKALGPKGLLDSTPHVQRTMPVMVAPVVDDSRPPEPTHKRTMLMESRRGPRPQDAETEAERTIAAAPPNPGGGDLIGKTIASRYRVLEKVGEGGMGTVYRAEHCLMEKIVALKILHPTLVSSSTTLERFRREIRATSRFQHKNVIQIYDAGEGEGGLFYMAMEFAEGEMLEDLLQREGPLPQQRLLHLLRQVLEAVGEAHKKSIVHRDLKSGNIILTRDKDGSELVKVMDFGIAKIALDEQDAAGGGLYKTQEGIVTGTPQYMSPEQASGEKVDHRSDLYSLGVILFEMLTGQLPFRSDTPMGFLGKHIVEPPPRPSTVTRQPIPTVLEEVVLKLLEKKPDARYQSASEVLADLELRCSGDGLRAISQSSSGAGGMRPPDSWAPTIETPVPRLARTIETPVSDAATLAPPIAAPDLRQPAKAAGGASGSSSGPNRTALVVGLVGLILVVASISTALAILSSQKPDLGAQVAQAEAILPSDPQRAIELIEKVLAEDPERADAQALMVQAKAAAEEAKNKGDAARQVEEADELVRQFDQEGGGRAVAEKAIQLYRMALKLHDTPDVRSKLDGLVKRLESVNRPDDRLLGKNLLLKVNGLLVQGKVAEAARLLKRAEGLLPADDEALQAQQQHLRAEQLALDAAKAEKAGRLNQALELLGRAIKAHPDRRAVTELEKRKARVTAGLARRAKSGQLEQHLAAALKAAGQLDLKAARAALAEATALAKDLDAAANGEVTARKTAVEKLAGFAPAWETQRAELAQMERSGGSPGAAEELRNKLRQHRAALKALKVDVSLAASLSDALEADIGRADRLFQRLKGKRDAAKSQALKRLEQNIAKFKQAEAALKVETYEAVDRLAQQAQDLQYDPALRKAPEKLRQQIYGYLRRWRERQRVWAELGKDMVQVKGGKWTAPNKRTHRLPPIYYVLQTEVTCGMWREYLRKNPSRRRPADLVGALSATPIRNISLRDAERYCKWRSKQSTRVEFRVPTEGEWERAARAAKGTDFPFGPKFESWMEASYANVEGGRPLRVTRTNTKDVNDWGLRDTAGNVREMTRSRRGGKVVICGGSFISGRKDSGAGARIYRDTQNVLAADVGLRIVAVEKQRR